MPPPFSPALSSEFRLRCSPFAPALLVGHVILQVDDLLLRFEQHGRKNEYVPVQRGSVPRQRLDRLGDAVHPRCFFDRLSNEFFHVAHPNNSSASSGVRPRSSIGSSSSTFGRNAMSLSTESAVSPRSEEHTS